MRGLNGRVTVVAGGATGIGAATAERLAAEGAHVVVGDLNAEGAESTAKKIRDAGGAAIATAFDITNEASVNDLIKSAVDTYGKLDGVHINVADMSVAAQTGDTDAVDVDLAIWDRTIEVNLRGHLLVARAAIPQLLSAGGGALVFTSSSAAFTSERYRVAYAASKAGVNALVRHISVRWGKEGIRANAVAPGVVLTESAVTVTTEEWRNMILPMVNSPRHGKPEDLAAMVTLLLSDDGEWINGQCIPVNGGVVKVT